MIAVPTSLEQEIIKGLSAQPKKIPSKYFYDERGDELFQQIMHLEEYYLPEAELDILTDQTKEIIANFPYDSFDIVELGAGDGSKVVHFLDNLMQLGKEITYYPLDISYHVLCMNKALMHQSIPSLEIELIPGDYFDTLAQIPSKKPKMVLFLGSNLGNFEGHSATQFIRKIKQQLAPGDILVLGLDLMKNPKKILAAYNDKTGITRDFNLNLLHRMNRELGANFKLDKFDHYPVYQPLTGTCYSFICSLEKQQVRVANEWFHFEEGEVIHTEVSQKYNIEKIKKLQRAVGFKHLQHLKDRNNLYSINIFS